MALGPYLSFKLEVAAPRHRVHPDTDSASRLVVKQTSEYRKRARRSVDSYCTSSKIAPRRFTHHIVIRPIITQRSSPPTLWIKQTPRSLSRIRQHASLDLEHIEQRRPHPPRIGRIDHVGLRFENATRDDDSTNIYKHILKITEHNA